MSDGFSLVLPFQIEADWTRIGHDLAPAIEQDPARQDSDVYRDLMSGDMALFRVAYGPANGWLVVEIAEPTFWVLYIAGEVAAEPRKWVRLLRSLLSEVEAIARRHGCSEVRFEGRDWSPIFPEYERLGGRNELRKAI